MGRQGGRPLAWAAYRGEHLAVQGATLFMPGRPVDGSFILIDLDGNEDTPTNVPENIQFPAGDR